MQEFTDAAVAEVFDGYPEHVRVRMLALRQLVFDTALETAGVGEVSETLKWGEPSYLAKTGSTIRMDWKVKTPGQYAMYFHCKTSLIETCKELYWGELDFFGNRAIVFELDDDLPVAQVKHCIMLSLTYHQRKHLPLLGA